MVMGRIRHLLEVCGTEGRSFPPTVLYNEGWLLRLVLDWFSTHRVMGHGLDFHDESRWYSEALVPSPFLATRRPDPLAEGWTHADAAVGHFDIGQEGKGDLKLRSEAHQLVIVEAKMLAGLSPGVTNARYYDQAARTVACMAEVLARGRRSPTEVSRLGYCVLAPQEQIRDGTFDKWVNKKSVGTKVERRVSDWVVEHDDGKRQWHAEWFEPMLEMTRLRVLSWEETIGTISDHDVESGDAIGAFYGECLKFNS